MPLPTNEERSLLDSLPHIVWIHSVEGTPLYFNATWVAYAGSSLEEATREGAASFVHPGDIGQVTGAFAKGQREGAAIETRYRLRRHDGVYRWHHARIVPFRRDGDRILSWLGSATDIHEEHELAEQRRYLLEASAILARSLATDVTLASVASLLVPHISDWCAIDLLREDGTLHRPAVAHVDPSKVELAWELWRRVPPRPDDATGAYGVIRSGTAEYTREITDEMLVAALPDQEILGLYRQLGLRSAMVVPLSARGRVIGTLSLVSSESGRLFEERDLAFTTELAGRIAVAVDNARLYEESQRARASAEAVAHEVMEQSHAVEKLLVDLRRERDEAVERAKGR